MKIQHYSIIVIVSVIALVPQFGVLGQDVNMSPPEKPEFAAKMDKMYYNNTDTAHVTIHGPPSTPANLAIVDSLSRQKLATIVQLNPNGTGMFSFDLASYNYGIYTTIVGYGYDRVKIEFGVGIFPAESGNILVFDLPKSDYIPSETIPIQGYIHPNSMVKMILIGPSGTKENSTIIRSDNSGKFLAEIGIPASAVNGTWKISATSGVSSSVKDVVVHSSSLRSPASYFASNDMLSPLKQFKSGIKPEVVQCNTGFELIFKSYDGSPACVKLDTAYNLVKRGWAASESAYPGNNSPFALYTNSTIIPGHLPSPSGFKLPISKYAQYSQITNYSGFVGVYNTTLMYRGTQHDYVLEPGNTGTITFEIKAQASELPDQIHPVPLPKSLNLTNYAVFYHEITSIKDLAKYPGTTINDDGFKACFTRPAAGGTCIGGPSDGKNHIEAWVTDHPGVNILFEPPVEVLSLGPDMTSQKVTMTITVDSGAPRGTYLVELSPSGEFLLTVGNQPYRE